MSASERVIIHGSTDLNGSYHCTLCGRDGSTNTRHHCEAQQDHEWCPSLGGWVPTNQPVHLGDGTTRPPEWPGEGCCEYGHTRDENTMTPHDDLIVHTDRIMHLPELSDECWRCLRSWLDKARPVLEKAHCNLASDFRNVPEFGHKDADEIAMELGPLLAELDKLIDTRHSTKEVD